MTLFNTAFLEDHTRPSMAGTVSRTVFSGPRETPENVNLIAKRHDFSKINVQKTETDPPIKGAV